MHARGMFGFKDCRFARMSSGRYCLIRDLGLVKGGKGLRHHEVLIAFSLRAALQRIRQAVLERLNRAATQTPDVGSNFRDAKPVDPETAVDLVVAADVPAVR
jgi:hypothetical protein